MSFQAKPLQQMARDGVVGVLTDVDDTLTTDGRLTAEAFDALWRLHRAGLKLVPVTGRSSGWAHMMLKSWPVDAVIAESGGLYLYRDHSSGAVCSRFHDDEARVLADRQRLQTCAEQVLARFPTLRPASDNAYRRVDLALDYCEEVPRLPDEQVREAMAMFHRAGFAARASSVHINAWSGQFDKAPMALRCLRERFGHQQIEVDDDLGMSQRRAWLFVGDAPNDASMFAAFPRTVAVANILDHRDRLEVWPVYITQQRYGAGFVEVVDFLLGG